MVSYLTYHYYIYYKLCHLSDRKITNEKWFHMSKKLFGTKAGYIKHDRTDRENDKQKIEIRNGILCLQKQCSLQVSEEIRRLECLYENNGCLGMWGRTGRVNIRPCSLLSEYTEGYFCDTGYILILLIHKYIIILAEKASTQQTM